MIQSASGRKHWAGRIMSLVGTFNVLFAFIGFLYNLYILFILLFLKPPDLIKYPYFYHAYFVLFSICTFLYVLLLVSGIQLIKKRLSWMTISARIFVFEMVLIFFPGFFWLHPKYGRSIGGASGVAIGGIMFQFFILYPFWAIILLTIAKRKYSKVIDEDINP